MRLYTGADPEIFRRGGPEAIIYKVLERGGPKSLKMAFECPFQLFSYRSFANMPPKGGARAPWAPPLNPPLLYVDTPKLAENIVKVPGSAYLTFDLNVSGHANNTLVNNVGRNLVKRQRVLFGGKVLQDTLDYDLFQTYHDLFLSKDERDNMLSYGVSSENM